MDLGKFGVTGLDGGLGGAKVEPFIGAIRKDEIFSARARPDLPGDKVIILAAAEDAVPGLNHEIKFSPEAHGRSGATGA